MKNKIIAILLTAVLIVIISGVVTYKAARKEKSYNEQIKDLARNLINEIL